MAAANAWIWQLQATAMGNAPMLREVVQPNEQAAWDAQQRLDEACRQLTRLDADQVEWTLAPADASGKRIVAEMLITDARDPLGQLARILQRIAEEVAFRSAKGRSFAERTTT